MPHFKTIGHTPWCKVDLDHEVVFLMEIENNIK